jgi:enoyl-CoA hydratase/carnithine racemase
VSIVCIRGRATGVGSELALASDMRFASREKAILSQWEVGAGLVPGGGPMARLPRLIGRGRALEVLLSADDIDGDLAERYGYVNRSFPDSELDAFVDALATRISSFDKRALAETKHLVDLNSLPPGTQVIARMGRLPHRPGTAGNPSARSEVVRARLSQPGDVETRLGITSAAGRSDEGPSGEPRTGACGGRSGLPSSEQTRHGGGMTTVGGHAGAEGARELAAKGICCDCGARR